MQKTILALSAILAALIISACSTTGSSSPGATYKMVNLEEAKALHERDALFIDVRSTQNYNDGHIAGAANIDPRRFTSSSLAKIANKDQEIVFYCYGMHCPISEKATSKARSWGYQKVYLFMKGYPAWWGAGYPIEQSSS